MFHWIFSVFFSIFLGKMQYIPWKHPVAPCAWESTRQPQAHPSIKQPHSMVPNGGFHSHGGSGMFFFPGKSFKQIDNLGVPLFQKNSKYV